MSSEDLLKRIEEVIQLAPESRHSYFQLKYFVLGKEPTIQAQMWKSLRELKSRKETIDAFTFEIADVKDRILLLDIEWEKEQLRMQNTLLQLANYPSDLLNRELAVKQRQNQRQKAILEESLRNTEKKLQYAWQEARFFLQAFEELSKLEPLRDYDDLESQKEYYDQKLSQQINLKMLLSQRLDTDIVETTLALPDDAPVKVQTMHILQHIESQTKQRYMAQLKEQDANPPSNKP